MSRFAIWWLAIRPATLIASISPVCIGTALAFRGGFFHPLTFFITMLYAIAIQIGTNFTNDFVDYLKGADTSERKGPTRVTQAGLVTVTQMKRATWITFGIAFLAGLYLISQGGGIPFAFLVLLSIFLGYIYTAGPYPLAYLGLGEIFILPFFGPIATVTTYLLQTGHMSWQALALGFAPGSLSCAILVINNLRDYEEDKKANKKTLIVRFGKKFGQLEYQIFLFIALLTPLVLAFDSPLALLALFSSLLAFPLVQQVKTCDAPLLPKTAGLLALFTLLLTIGLIL